MHTCSRRVKQSPRPKRAHPSGHPLCVRMRSILVVCVTREGERAGRGVEPKEGQESSREGKHAGQKRERKPESPTGARDSLCQAFIDRIAQSER